MTEPDRHPDEQLDAWLDGRLGESEGRAFEEHLAACARCRRLTGALGAARESLRTGVSETPPPAGLVERITAALDAEDDRARRVGEPARPRTRAALRRLWPLAAGLAAAAVAAALLLWLAPGDGADLPAAMSAEYARLDRDGLPPELVADLPETIERRWARANLGFPARVLDLSAMGIRLAGGGAASLRGVPVALTVYRGDQGLLLCWMLPGAALELPAGGEVRRHGGFEFHVHRRGEETIVFWREGEVLCALAGRGDAEGVVALAFAKAMAPAAV